MEQLSFHGRELRQPGRYLHLPTGTGLGEDGLDLLWIRSRRPAAGRWGKASKRYLGELAQILRCQEGGDIDETIEDQPDDK